METPFQKIITLLESYDQANIRLALQLAQNHIKEFEEYYGATPQDLLWIMAWVWQYLPNEENPLKSTKLNLSGKNLTTLPLQISALKHLEYLNLVQNQLTVLPPEIGQLTNLSNLNLMNNQLKTLPDSF